MRLARNIALWTLLAAMAAMLTACGGGDAGGTSSLGYRVDLSVTQEVISPGGTTTLIATVTLHGQAAPDGTTVIFTSSLGGGLTGVTVVGVDSDDDTTNGSTDGSGTSGTATTKSGVATAVYTAPAEATGTDRVTATALDAYDSVDIYIRIL